MSRLIEENFENFGLDIQKMLQGIWSDLGSGVLGVTETNLIVPAFDTLGRTWMTIGHPVNGARGAGARRVFPGAALSAVGVWLQWYQPVLPDLSNRQWLWQLRDGGNAPVCTLSLDSDGRISVLNASGVTVAQTATAVVVAGSIQRLQAQITLNGATGAVELRMNGVVTPVLNATGLALPGTTTQFFIGMNTPPSGTYPLWYVKACAAYSLTGTYNNSWPNITGIVSIYPEADTAATGFTGRPRQIIGAGDLLVPGDGSLLDCGQDVDYSLGNAAYTLETFYRPVVNPTGTNFATILGKWSASTSNRSYRLVQYGPGINNGALRFEVTTDGTLATLQTIFSVIYPFVVGHTYALAVVRSGGFTQLYINGVKVGNPQADAFTYFAAGLNAKFTVGGEMSGTGSTVLALSSVNAIFDEIRITPGVARYAANYTPTTIPYPRTAPSDPSFASVVLLAGFDAGVVDESSQAQTLVARGTAARIVPNDGAADYQTVNAADPLDDRYLEAALVSASGILTLDALPLNGQQVVLGATTYTFNTVLGAANSVLIGASIQASSANLTAAINAGAGIGTLYGTGTVANASAVAAVAPADYQVTATAITAGTAGNSIVTTETLTQGSWTAATLTGGLNLPTNSTFDMQSIPPTVTGVRWLAIRNRSYLDSGSGKIQPAFVVAAAVASGVDQSISTSPTYYVNAYEEDPNTVAALTPASVNNGQARLSRTA